MLTLAKAFTRMYFRDEFLTWNAIVVVKTKLKYFPIVIHNLKLKHSNAAYIKLSSLC